MRRHKQPECQGIGPEVAADFVMRRADVRELTDVNVNHTAANRQPALQRSSRELRGARGVGYDRRGELKRAVRWGCLLVFVLFQVACSSSGPEPATPSQRL